MKILMVDPGPAISANQRSRSQIHVDLTRDSHAFAVRLDVVQTAARHTRAYQSYSLPPRRDFTMAFLQLETWSLQGLALLALFVGWLVLEAVFYYLVAGPWAKAMDILSHTPVYSIHPEALVEKVCVPQISLGCGHVTSTFCLPQALSTIDQIPGYSVATFIRGWFHDVELSEIWDENVIEFLAWAMYNKHREDLDEEERTAALHVIGQIHSRYGLKLSPGFNPNVSTIKVCVAPPNLPQWLTLHLHSLPSIMPAIMSSTALSSSMFSHKPPRSCSTACCSKPDSCLTRLNGCL